jgi:[acyl-carrier-protein] S-malonyltransferase
VEKDTAFFFPGQGAQRVGMGADLCHRFAAARDVFERADDYLGFSLSRMCFEGPAETLDADLNSQLSVYTHSCALASVLGPERLGSGMVTGYSSGFYAAAFAAGCFDFEIGLGIVHMAGTLLLEAATANPGAMGVIFGLAPECVHAICAQSGAVQPAIYNTPRQIVISGAIAAVQNVIDQALAQGALDAYRLPAAAAYHSASMRPAAHALSAALAQMDLKAPHTPLISYSTLEAVADGAALARLLASHLCSPVRWVELIGSLHQKGIRTVVEVGPGQILCRSVRWIERNLTTRPLSSAAALAAFVDAGDQDEARARP